MNPQRMYLRLLDNPPLTGTGDEQLEQVRRAVESLGILEWDAAYPRVSPRGGWDVAFYIADTPNDVTFEQWLEQLGRRGLFPVI